VVVVVATGAGLIVIVIITNDVQSVSSSSIRTVKTASVWLVSFVGVPVMTPVDPLIVSPAGSAGEIEKLYSLLIPMSEYVVVAASATPTVPTTF
jgi:hypothetical protein